MVVAKRQRKKPTKMEQRKVQGQEWEPQVKQTALLASLIYIGLVQGEKRKGKKKKKNNIKRGAKIEQGAHLSSLHVFQVGPPSCLKDVFSFACQRKLRCNTGPCVTSNFCCGKTELRKLQTPPTKESEGGDKTSLQILLNKNIHFDMTVETRWGS